MVETERGAITGLTQGRKYLPTPEEGAVPWTMALSCCPFPTGPPLRIFPAPSPHGLTRTPGKTHPISAYPGSEGSAQPLVCGSERPTPRPHPNSRVQFHLPAFPPHSAFSLWNSHNVKQPTAQTKATLPGAVEEMHRHKNEDQRF